MLSYICSNFAKVDWFLIFTFIIDGILLIASVALVWYYVATSKKVKAKNKIKSEKKLLSESIEKVDDETYIIPESESNSIVNEEPMKKDNAVEHFANQLSGINEEVNTQLTSNAVVVKHEVAEHKNKIPVKEEIQNYVVVGGVKKQKTESQQKASFNRGSNAFKNATDFVSRIKEESDKK